MRHLLQYLHACNFWIYGTGRFAFVPVEHVGHQLSADPHTIKHPVDRCCLTKATKPSLRKGRSTSLVVSPAAFKFEQQDNDFIQPQG